MAKSKFVYRGSDRTTADMERKASEGTRDYDSVFKTGTSTFTPKEGENCVRILPAPPDQEEPDWDYIIYQHYDVGPDNARYLCLNKMKGEACPVCDAQREAADKEESDALRASKGAICWVIDRDNEKAGPQVWSIPFTKVRNEIYTRSKDRKTGHPILVDHPDEGFDIVFNRTGKDKTNTVYSGVEVMRDPSPIHEDIKIQDKWLDYIADNPLPSVLNFYPAEHIEKVLFGKKSAKTKEDEPEQEPVRGRRALATEEEPEPTSRRSSRRGEPEEEAEAEPRASRLERRRAAVEEENPPFERTRRGSRAEEEEAETAPAGRGRRGVQEAEEEESPTTQARASLERLKTRRRAS